MSNYSHQPPEDDWLSDVHNTLRNQESHGARRPVARIANDEPFSTEDRTPRTIPTSYRHSSNGYVSRDLRRGSSFASSRQSSYYASTASSSALDTASLRSSASTIVEPSAENLPALYPCELEGINCEWWYILSHRDEWIRHVAVEHMQEMYPRVTECWFCDRVVFRAEDSSQAARKAAFWRRMEHIAHHLRVGETERRPDFHLLKHMIRKGLVPAWVEEAARNYHEAPQPSDVEFVPESMYARGAGHRHRHMSSYTVSRGRGEASLDYYD